MLNVPRPTGRKRDIGDPGVAERRPVSGFMKFRLAVAVFGVLAAILWLVESEPRSAGISLLVSLIAMTGYVWERGPRSR